MNNLTMAQAGELWKQGHGKQLTAMLQRNQVSGIPKRVDKEIAARPEPIDFDFELGMMR